MAQHISLESKALHFDGTTSWRDLEGPETAGAGPGGPPTYRDETVVYQFQLQQRAGRPQPGFPSEMVRSGAKRRRLSA